MQVPFTTLSEAADMMADYLKREANESGSRTVETCRIRLKIRSSI
jgi:hypothetical protein